MPPHADRGNGRTYTAADRRRSSKTSTHGRLTNGHLKLHPNLYQLDGRDPRQKPMPVIGFLAGCHPAHTRDSIQSRTLRQDRQNDAPGLEQPSGRWSRKRILIQLANTRSMTLRRPGDLSGIGFRGRLILVVGTQMQMIEMIGEIAVGPVALPEVRWRLIICVRIQRSRIASGGHRCAYTVRVARAVEDPRLEQTP